MAASSSTEKISMNINDYGVPLDNKKRKVQCSYCDKVVSGFHRLKFHLARVRGDVAPCTEGPIDVQAMFKQQIDEAKGKGLARELEFQSQAATSTSTTAAGCTCTASGSTGDAADNLQAFVCKRVVDFFFEAETNDAIADCPIVHRMLKETTLGQGERQSSQILSSHELKKQVVEVQLKIMREKISQIRHSWATNGCTILIDEWIDEKAGRCLINFIVDCALGPIFLRSSDVSDIVGDDTALQNLLDDVIQEVGQENVVQVMTCSMTSRMFPVCKKAADRYKSLFWAVSVSDCIGLMLERIAEMDEIKSVLNKATSLTSCIYGDPMVLKLFRGYARINQGGNLMKPSKMRSEMYFLTLESILSNEDALKHMFDSLKWENSSWLQEKAGKRAAKLVKDPKFWDGVERALKATGSLLRTLELIKNEDKPYIGFIYETIDQVKETIRNEFRKNKSEYMPVWRLIDDIWDSILHSPLHAAAYYLNPSFFYTKDFRLDDEICNGLLRCTVCMEKDRDVQYQLSKQLNKYSRAYGDFSHGCSPEIVADAHPGEWWLEYGDHCPELKRYVIRILSQTCDGAVRYKLDKSLAEKLLINKRSDLEQGLLRDFLFVHYNLQLGQVGEEFKVENEIVPMANWITDNESQHEGSSTGMDLDCSNEETFEGGPSIKRRKVGEE